jgi:hydrogenase/urease accessory protein HupE
VRAALPEDVAEVRASFAAPCVASAGEEEGDPVTTVACPGSLAGSRITVQGLGPILSEAILVVSLHGGERVSRVLTPKDPSFELPAAQTGPAVARSYVRLGVAHILTGYDHLLFLLTLVLLLRKPRAVLLAETAFTVSHSLSFSATALGLIRVSAPAAEAAIALSLVLVALDVGRPGADESARSGAAMAFVFGLVHGLGFAGGLSEVGLPLHHVSAALAGFAAGVEIGQVAFLAVALAVLHLAQRRLAAPRVEAIARWGSVLVGGVATYWLLERTLVCLSPRI